MLPISLSLGWIPFLLVICFPFSLCTARYNYRASRSQEEASGPEATLVDPAATATLVSLLPEAAALDLPPETPRRDPAPVVTPVAAIFPRPTATADVLLMNGLKFASKSLIPYLSVESWTLRHLPLESNLALGTEAATRELLPEALVLMVVRYVDGSRPVTTTVARRISDAPPVTPNGAGSSVANAEGPPHETPSPQGG